MHLSNSHAFNSSMVLNRSRGVKKRSRTSPTWFSTWPFSQPEAGVLARLDVATRPEQLKLPGFGLHRLEGDLAGYWSVAIRGDWRIIFHFDVGSTTDVDLVEY